MYKWIALILILLGIDQASKAIVVANIPFTDSVHIIGDFFRFTYIRNDGAVFGSFPGLNEKYYIFLIFVVIAVGIFGYLFVKNDFSDKRTTIYVLSICLLIAGALGNAIDRVFQPDHMVVDFIDFNGIWHYIFNFADVWLNVGIALFLIDTIFLEPKRKKQTNG